MLIIPLHNCFKIKKFGYYKFFKFKTIGAFHKFYKNYSYKRSPTGLNLIGDYTFVGTEMASPSQTGPNTEAHDPNAVYVTNYGEVVYESATPDLLRFIDTTSRIDIVSYKHAFTNLTRKRNTNI